MREDTEPWAQPPPLSPPCPSIPSCGQWGLPALGPARVSLLCSFHVNLFIYRAPKTVSEMPGGAVCGVLAWPLGEHWAAAACQEPSVPLALSSSSSSSEAAQGAGMGPGQL